MLLFFYLNFFFRILSWFDFFFKVQLVFQTTFFIQITIHNLFFCSHSELFDFGILKQHLTQNISSAFEQSMFLNY
jgi:hypothetical protein